MPRYLNSQDYYECQFITAINAAVYFGQPGIMQYSVEYERWVDFLTGARDEGILNINPAVKYLGLGYKRVPVTPSGIMKSLDNGHPVELAFHSKLHGIHSALAIEYNSEELRVPNNGFSKGQWISWKLITQRIKNGPRVAKSRNIDCDDFKKGFKSFYIKDPFDVVFELED